MSQQLPCESEVVQDLLGFAIIDRLNLVHIVVVPLHGASILKIHHGIRPLVNIRQLVVKRISFLEQLAEHWDVELAVFG